MTKARAFPVIAVVVIALTLLNTALILVGKHENASRANETRNLALANCHGIGALARIERAFIDRQEKQTQVLLKSGITFGIPESQLPKLIAASKASQATFLNDLTVLTTQTCAGEEPVVVPVLKPHGRKAKKHVTTVTPTGTGVTGAVKAGQVRRATPRTLPVPRPTRTVTKTTIAPSRAQEAPPSTSTTSTTPTTPTTPTTTATPEPERHLVIPPVPCVKVAGITVC